MNTQYVALNQNNHNNIRVASGFSFDGAKDQHLLPIAVTEFEQASGSLPIAFVKNSSTGQFESVVILGFKKGENLCFKDNHWLSEFVPQIIQRYPFALTEKEDDGQQLLVAIDQNSSMVGTSVGERLFDENGVETQYLEKRKQDLQIYHEGCMYGQIFIQRLVDFGLLEMTNVSLQVADEKIEVAGIYVINQEKLNRLDAEKFIELRNVGDLPAIYAHLNSLKQFNRLAKLKGQQ